MSVNIVIPMKDASQAKSRLRGAFANQERIALVNLLYRETLAFFATQCPYYQLSVVTPSASSAAMARRYGAAVIREDAATGLSVAAATAATWSRRHGFDAQLLIPADIATLDSDEIMTVLRTDCSAPAVVICPAQDGGTNALLTSPPDTIDFRFGYMSGAAHEAAAEERGMAYQKLMLKHLSRDVDTPADYAEFMQPDGLHKQRQIQI